MRKISAVQDIVEHYKILKGYDKIKNWDKVNFNRHLRSAKTLLELTDGSIEEAKHALTTLSKFFNTLEMKSWKIEACIRNYPDLVAGNLKDKKGKTIYYVKEDNSFSEEEVKENLEKLRTLKSKLWQKSEKIFQPLQDYEY